MAAEKNKVGRPSEYNPEYCDKLITHMSEGLSFESFAGTIGVSKQALYDWTKVHDEFLYAKEIGFEKSRLFWETAGINLAVKGIGNATAFVFNMKNRFRGEWNDKTEVETNNTTTIVDPSEFMKKLLE